MMTAKEYLQQARLIERRITTLIEQAQELKRFAANCTARITGMPKAKGRTLSPLEDAVCEMVDTEREIAAEIKRLHRIKEGIRRTIDAVKDPDCCAVLTKRYLRGRTWAEIAKEMRYSKRWVLSTHSKALDMVQKIINESGHNI